MLFDIKSYLGKALSPFEGRGMEAHWETDFSWFKQARKIIQWPGEERVTRET